MQYAAMHWITTLLLPAIGINLRARCTERHCWLMLLCSTFSRLASKAAKLILE